MKETEKTETNEMPKKKKKESQKSNTELIHLKEECQKKDEKILRLSAEIQNIQRRNADERAKLLKYNGEEVILKMLTILDNFEHAIKMDNNDLNDEVSKFLSGFKMLYGNMKDALEELGVCEIPCLHEAFDETKMNAVLVDHDPEFDHMIVLNVLQKGYLYKDKIIRPAMVKVNNKESE